MEFDRMFKDRLKGMNSADERSQFETGGFISQRSVSSGIAHQIQELANQGGIVRKGNQDLAQRVAFHESQKNSRSSPKKGAN